MVTGPTGATWLPTGIAKAGPCAGANVAAEPEAINSARTWPGAGATGTAGVRAAVLAVATGTAGTRDTEGREGPGALDAMGT